MNKHKHEKIVKNKNVKPSHLNQQEIVNSSAIKSDSNASTDTDMDAYESSFHGSLLYESFQSTSSSFEESEEEVMRWQSKANEKSKRKNSSSEKKRNEETKNIRTETYDERNTE